MIDLHSHLLFGLDDGAHDENAMCRMLEAYARQKVTTVVATSHSSVSRADYGRVFELAFSLAQKFGIGLLPGREYFLADATEQKDDLQTLGESSFLLLDLEHFSVNSSLNNTLMTFSHPLIFAHPERLWGDAAVKNAEFLVERNECFFQLNSGSFAGRYGKTARRAAWQLLNAGFCSVIASDAHHASGIDLAACRKMLGACFPKEQLALLFEENPARILSGKKPLPVCFRQSFSGKIQQFFRLNFGRKWKNLESDDECKK